jgi:hypothetical protein
LESLSASRCLRFQVSRPLFVSSVYFPGWLDGGTSTRSYSGIVAAMTGPVDGCGGSAPVPSAEKIAKAIEITSPPRGIRVVPCQLTHDQAARLAEYWSPTRSVARPAARPRAAILAGWSLLAQPDLQDARSAEARFHCQREPRAEPTTAHSLCQHSTRSRPERVAGQAAWRAWRRTQSLASHHGDRAIHRPARNRVTPERRIEGSNPGGDGAPEMRMDGPHPFCS